MKTAYVLTALAAVASVPATAATIVHFDAGLGSLPAGFTTFQDFEGFSGGTPGESIGTNTFVYSDSVSGQAARPNFGSTGNFAAVRSGGSYTVNFAATNALSFVLGSLDTYNTVTLLYEDGTSQSYAGGQIINDLSFPSGNQISGETNGVVTYTVTSGPLLTGLTFSSSSDSFEFDNLAVAAAAVPEPAAWALLIGGFGLVGMSARRRTRMSVACA
ncbi:MAG: PEPxxWA-CTERM sorting domain-containing protein [Proteobacteria bacterium]|nr:PEPxxWA-CTERM sorting domain-containing protein [Pseudomonadota bacterium]